MSKLAQLRAQRDAKAKAASELNAKTPADQRMPAADASVDGLVAVCGPDGVAGLGRVSAGLLAPQRLFNLPGGDASR